MMWEIKSKKKKKHVVIEPLKSSSITADEQSTNGLFVNQDYATDFEHGSMNGTTTYGIIEHEEPSEGKETIGKAIVRTK